MSIYIYIYTIYTTSKITQHDGPCKDTHQRFCKRRAIGKTKKQCKHVRDEPTSSSSLALSPVFLSNHFCHLQHRQQKPKSTGPTSQTRGGSTNAVGSCRIQALTDPKWWSMVVKYSQANLSQHPKS